MDRKHSVLAAGGVSAVLVVGSTAFAFANGIFIAKPVDRVGSYQAIQARLVPATKPIPTSPAVGAPPRERSAPAPAPAPPTGGAAMTTARRIVPIAVAYAVPTVQRPMPPTRAPAVRAATKPIAHSGPSAVSRPDDDHESIGGSESDD